MNRGLVLLGSAALVAALLYLLLIQDRGSVSPASGRSGQGAQNVAVTPTPAAVSPPTSRASAAAASASDADDIASLRVRYARSSLRGSTPDGEVALDANGALRLDAGVVRRFEHYLSLLGEFELGEIRQLLRADLQAEVGDVFAATILDAFDRYVGLRQALAEIELSSDLATRLEQLRTLRRDWFGVDAEMMFGAEEAEIAYTLARREVETDASLDAAARRARLAELDAARAPFERQAQRDATTAVLAEEQSRQFEQRGTDAATRHEERAALWGEDAADRLAALDRDRADWDRRVSEFARERERILADPAFDATARQRALTTERLRRFTPQEQARIEALEAIGALPHGG